MLCQMEEGIRSSGPLPCMCLQRDSCFTLPSDDPPRGELQEGSKAFTVGSYAVGGGPSGCPEGDQEFPGGDEGFVPLRGIASSRF